MAHLFETTVGGLGWLPVVFWRATISEVFAAIDGHNQANRVGPEPMLRDELEELMAEYPD